MLQIKPRNWLTFPVGAKYGIDPNHPAGLPTSHWVTAQPVAAITTDVYRNNNGHIGPTYVFPTAANGSTTNHIYLGCRNNGNTVTFAAIVTNSGSNGGRCWLANLAGNRGLALNNGSCHCYTNLSNDLSVGPVDLFTNKTPVFFAFSATANSKWFGIRRDLNTGKVYTNNGTLGAGAVATDDAFGTVFVGKLWNHNEHATFELAAYGATFTQMSADSLMAWSKDPWSFWYPNA